MSDMITVKIIRVNGIEEEHTVENDIDLFKRLYPLVDSQCFDLVRLPDGVCMLVDDDGHMRERPVNAKATQLYWSATLPGTTHQIVGDVVLMKYRDLK